MNKLKKYPILEKYIDGFNNIRFIDNYNYQHRIMDHTISFVEENDLHDLFVTCKLNPVAFYGFCKYKIGNHSIDKLKEIVRAVNG